MNVKNRWPTTRLTLVHRLRDTRDQDAWRLFVETYAPLVFRYCRKRGLQNADAHNVTQEVFLHVSRAMRSFQYDMDRGPFRNWFGLVTHQRLMRYYKRHPVAPQTEGIGSEVADNRRGDLDAEWVDLFNAHVYRLAIERVRVEFDDACWRAFERVWDGGENPGDVAQEFACDPQWVYQAKHRVLKRLREEVTRLADDAAMICREEST